MSRLTHPCQFEERRPVVTNGRKKVRVTYCPLPARIAVGIDGEQRKLCVEHFDQWCAALMKQLRRSSAA